MHGLSGFLPQNLTLQIRFVTYLHQSNPFPTSPSCKTLGLLLCPYSFVGRMVKKPKQPNKPPPVLINLTYLVGCPCTESGLFI